MLQHAEGVSSALRTVPVTAYGLLQEKADLRLELAFQAKASRTKLIQVSTAVQPDRSEGGSEGGSVCPQCAQVLPSPAQ